MTTPDEKSGVPRVSVTPAKPGPPHGLYDIDGKRIKGWKGRIKMSLTNAPELDPPLRLAPGEQVFAWHRGELVAIFTDGGISA